MERRSSHPMHLSDAFVCCLLLGATVMGARAMASNGGSDPASVQQDIAESRVATVEAQAEAAGTTLELDAEACEQVIDGWRPLPAAQAYPLYSRFIFVLTKSTECRQAAHHAMRMIQHEEEAEKQASQARSYQVALERAHEQASSLEGQRRLDRLLSFHFENQFAGYLTYCVRQRPRPSTLRRDYSVPAVSKEEINLVFEVNEEGKVERVHIKEREGIALCVAQRMRHYTFEEPGIERAYLPVSYEVELQNR